MVACTCFCVEASVSPGSPNALRASAVSAVKDRMSKTNVPA